MFFGLAIGIINLGYNIELMCILVDSAFCTDYSTLPGFQMITQTTAECNQWLTTAMGLIP